MNEYSRPDVMTVSFFRLLICFLLPLSVCAQTTIENDIGMDTRWTAAGSPYVVSSWGIDVLAGATLTIDPGVEVRFECGGGGLVVYGTLIAEGTASQPILFTGTTKTPGCWDGIDVIGTEDVQNTGSKLVHSTIEYGGGWMANIYLKQATMDIRNSRVRYSQEDGIYTVFSAVAHVRDTAFSENAGYAIHIYDADVNPDLGSLSATGNGKDAVVMYRGTVHGNHLWERTGIPYEISGSIDIAADGYLSIEPGTDLRFDNGSSLDVYGKVNATGSDSQRIRITAVNPSPGWWEGIHVVGENSQLLLDYADVEYGGGYYANIYVNGGHNRTPAQVTITNSRIRHSSADGLYFGGSSAAASSIVGSTISNNQGYGIQNYDGTDASQQLLATNNWWGDASGPYHANCNPGGTGDGVTDGVIMTPFLTSENQDPGELAGSDAYLLEIRPDRWFVPADGVSEALVRMSIKDSAGFPVSGTFLLLNSDLGTVTNGLQTDFRGETAATILSDTQGEAKLTAVLDFATSCEYARSPSATIAFTPHATDNDLFPDAQAPYMNERLEFDPQPITRGQPTEVSATLTNPNDFPVSVDAVLSTGAFGIGQPFSEIATFNGRSIPANSTATLSTTWTPVVSGHYCTRLSYTASGQGSWSGTGDSNQNLNIAPAALGSGSEKRALDLAERYTGIMNHDAVTIGLNATTFWNIPYQLIHTNLIGYHLNWMFTTARTISRALGGDPPRPDYDLFTFPDKPEIPQASAGTDGLSTNRAEAINALTEAMLDAIYNGRAAGISLDRYGGASAAGDLVWSSRQADAMLYYKQRLGEDLIRVSERLDELLEVARQEGFTDEVLTLDQVRAYQQLLADQGYSSDELAAAHALGLMDEEIQALLQEQINADPQEVTLSRVTYVQQLVQAYLDLGNILASENMLARDVLRKAESGGNLVRTYENTETFTSANVLRNAESGGNLVRTYENTQTFTLANPLTAEALVSLKIRRLDIPAEWLVNVVPEQITLMAGEETEGSIKVNATTPWIKGTSPRVAVEGYVGTELIGGVVVDILIPRGGFVGCSGHRVLIPDNTQFPPGTTECVAAESITAGRGVTVDKTSKLIFLSPVTSLKAGFTAKKGALFSIRATE